MAKKSMAQHAKGWKSPDERRELRREAAGAPKGNRGKNSGDSRGPGPEGFTKAMKKPKGGGR